jgi:hypothetical protein
MVALQQFSAVAMRLRWSASVVKWSWSIGEARRVRRGSQIDEKPWVDEAHCEGGENSGGEGELRRGCRQSFKEKPRGGS